jgi:hypothetical protein
MKNRLAKTLLATAAIGALAAPVGALARQGADDPAGHVRHAAHQTTTSSSSSSAVKHRSRTRDRDRHGRRHGRGTDDRVAGHRRGRGTDDGPNHS